MIGIFVGGYDSSAIHKAVADLAEREAFLSEVLRSSTDCIKVLDLDGRLTFMSEGGQKVMEVDDFAAIAECPWPSFWEGEGDQLAKDAIAAAREGRSAKFIGAANTAKGTPKWWDVSVAPILGPDGKPAKILSVSRDTTELVAAQERQRLLNAELGHRLKNVLTMVQAIASQTFRRAQSVDEAAERLRRAPDRVRQGDRRADRDRMGRSLAQGHRRFGAERRPKASATGSRSTAAI